MPADTRDTMLNGMTPKEAARALVEGRLGMDFGDPPKTLGERVMRHLYVDAMNRELERMGVPVRIVPVKPAGGPNAC